MEFFLLLFVGAVVVGVLIGIGRARGVSASQKANALAFNSLADFQSSIGYNGTAHSPGVAIDAVRKKFAILDSKKGNQSVFSFSDLVAVEVLKNEAAVTATNRGSQVVGAAVGGVLLGPLGLLMGGLTGSKRNESKIKKLSLKLYTNDLVKPVHEVCFFDAAGTKGSLPDSPVLKKPLEELDAWYGRFRTIMHMQSSAGIAPDSSFKSPDAVAAPVAVAGRIEPSL